MNNKEIFENAKAELKKLGIKTDSIEEIREKDGISLPSANVVFDKTTDSMGNVTDITAYGGGFGHGVGMSQNGARNLADLGYNAKDILEFYYEGCEVRE